jgi:UDP-galactopyranose mutase
MKYLIQSPHPWRGIDQRAHHLARRFARAGHRVHWVEPRYARWLLERPGDFWRARRESPEPSLAVRPATLVNGERLGFIRAHNRYWLARAMRAGAADDGPRVLWLYDPHQGFLADRVPHELLVYDIMDEYTGFPWSPPNVAEEEAALLARADWVFAGTGALYDAKRERAEGRIECILSGVEPEHFARPGIETRVDGTRADEVHDGLRKQYRRLAGYAGMVDLRIDLELLRRVALAMPDWGFVLLGPVRIDLRGLQSAPNVYALGARSYGELPGYYHAWDAALLPFVENTLTRHLNPTKMLEYAAAGRPIVARALPDVERFYSDGAWLYRDAEGVVAAMRAIDRGAPEVAERQARARGWIEERSWDRLAGRMLDRVAELLDAKRKR